MLTSQTQCLMINESVRNHFLLSLILMREGSVCSDTKKNKFARAQVQKRADLWNDRNYWFSCCLFVRVLGRVDSVNLSMVNLRPKLLVL